MITKIKNKRYNIDVTIPIDLQCLVDIFDNEAKSHPEKFAQVMVEFGHDGDWTLEIEYLKYLKKDIKSDYGKKVADLLQQVIDALETPIE